MKLNIGAGENIRSSEDGSPHGEVWTNLDIRPLKNIDVVIDLERNNLPFGDNSVDEVNIQDFLEHLGVPRQESFLKDVYRVMKIGAVCYIQLPDLENLAKRYCGVLESPTSMQGRLDARQLAFSLYGGQDYEYNYHKWGYDTQSLTAILEKVGFVVRDAHNDGGANLLCWAVKPYEKITLPVGGGIGDILQIYLANPSSRKCYEDGPDRLKSPDDEFPTSNIDSSLWLRRLKSLKTVYPRLQVKIVITSTNTVSKEIFEHNPYIDIVEVWDKAPKSWFRYIDAAGFIHVEGSWLVYQKLLPEPVRFYMASDEEKLCEAAKKLGKYIVIHPYAGASERVVITEAFCRRLVDRLIDDLGYHVIVVGKASVPVGLLTLPEDFRYQREGLTSLVNKVSINASARLVLNASAFIGMHSCMALCAWYAGIPTICLVPPAHDDGQPWEEFFADETNPTTWGARKPFNRTIIVPEKDAVSVAEVVGNLRSLGVGL